MTEYVDRWDFLIDVFGYKLNKSAVSYECKIYFPLVSVKPNTSVETLNLLNLILLQIEIWIMYIKKQI